MKWRTLFAMRDDSLARDMLGQDGSIMPCITAVNTMRHCVIPRDEYHLGVHEMDEEEEQLV